MDGDKDSVEGTVSTKPIFKDLDPDDNDPETTEVESLCMSCEKNGITRIFMTKIPHYKEIVVMSFECEHCGHKDNEIQDAGKIAEKGVKYVLTINSVSDLDRQVVKSDHTSVQIPHLNFEIPAQSQKGEITTMEGIIDRCIRGLSQDQDRRREGHPEAAEKIDQFIQKLEALKIVEDPFSVILEDVSGNCFIENPYAPKADQYCKAVQFKRSKEQNEVLGIYEENEIGLLAPINEEEYSLEKMEGEVLTFPTNCPACDNPCETNMKLTNIPHFKQVVIMATVCDSCGLRTNEVKSGAGIEPEGINIEIEISGREDFSRDLLKSETCRMSIPELELDVGPTTLGGRFTTVEGMLQAVREQLGTSTAFTGDSATAETKEKMSKFLKGMDLVLRGEKSVKLILDDPAGNSYVQSLADVGPDDRLKIFKYKRDFDQNEELGINDMKVEDYE